MDLPGKHLPPLHSDLPGTPLPGKRQNDTHHQTEAYPAELIEHLTTSPSRACPRPTAPWRAMPQGPPQATPPRRAMPQGPPRLPHPGVPCHRARQGYTPRSAMPQATTGPNLPPSASACPEQLAPPCSHPALLPQLLSSPPHRQGAVGAPIFPPTLLDTETNPKVLRGEEAP